MCMLRRCVSFANEYGNYCRGFVHFSNGWYHAYNHVGVSQLRKLYTKWYKMLMELLPIFIER